MRIGHGFDAHRFRDGDRVVLGGVEIPHSHGLAAHSDGDVLLHAVCDALLGAAALGDIGRHFPDSDPAFKGISSRVLVRNVIEMLAAKSLRVGHVDATIVAERPRMAPHIDRMCRNLAADCKVDLDSVNVKATTTEGMGFTGRGEGIAAYAVVIVLE